MKLDLRGKNRWLKGLGPTGTDPRAEAIVSAVRQDDSFVNLKKAKLEFRSSRSNVLDVSSRGRLVAKRPGVATISVSFGGKSARMPFAVRAGGGG